MAVHWFEVEVLSWAVVTAMCTAVFLGMQEQVLILPIKDWVPCPPPTISPSSMPKKKFCDLLHMLCNKRCISVAVWQEAEC